jgi:hypothetical protein
MQKSIPFRRVADCNLIHPENDGFHKPELSGCPAFGAFIANLGDWV